jgi:hypothetical protein
METVPTGFGADAFADAVSDGTPAAETVMVHE